MGEKSASNSASLWRRERDDGGEEGRRRRSVKRSEDGALMDSTGSLIPVFPCSSHRSAEADRADELQVEKEAATELHPLQAHRPQPGAPPPPRRPNRSTSAHNAAAAAAQHH